MTDLQLLAIVLAGWVLTLFLERLMAPRPRLFSRPASAHAIHLGLWTLLFGVPLLAIQHPLLMLAVFLSIWLLLVVVNNSKFARLREPLIFTDLEFVSYAVRHPRLYVPFLGLWRGILLGVLSAGIVYALWRIDSTLDPHPMGPDHLLLIVAVATVAGSLVWWGARASAPPTLDPAADFKRSGLLASFWQYRALDRRARPEPVRTPFHAVAAPAGVRPDIIAIQSESFFDARRLHQGVRRDVLAEFDALRESADAEGHLLVPAWGANTVRTEFSFLSGVANDALGIDRFNPYRTVLRRPIQTLASSLKQLGYRTICIHPYLSSFYARDRVYPVLGFDEFIDIRSFTAGDRFGPYVSDAAVADRVMALADGSDRPVFVFVITMENHGPLHLESVAPGESATYLTADFPPAITHDLTAYLRHLKNADRMLATLRSWLATRSRPGHVCFFGDHVPIMPTVYKSVALSDGHTDYVVFGPKASGGCRRQDLSIEQVGTALLASAGLLPRTAVPGSPDAPPDAPPAPPRG